MIVKSVFFFFSFFLLVFYLAGANLAVAVVSLRLSNFCYKFGIRTLLKCFCLVDITIRTCLFL